MLLSGPRVAGYEAVQSSSSSSHAQQSFWACWASVGREFAGAGGQTSRSKISRRRYVLVCIFNTVFSVATGLLLPYVLENGWMSMPSYLREDCGLGSGGSGSPDDEITDVCIYRVSLRRGGVALMILFTVLAVGSCFDARVHDSFWLTKYVAFVALQSVLFLSQFIASSSSMSDLWGWFDHVGRIAGALWLAVQGLVVLDLAHELHVTLVLSALRQELERQVLASKVTYGAHMVASSVLSLAVIATLSFALMHVVPAYCSASSPASASSSASASASASAGAFLPEQGAASTASILVAATAVLGVLACLASLFRRFNKGLLVPAVLFAYQALVILGIVSSDLCHIRPAWSDVQQQGQQQGQWAGNVLALPLVSLGNTVGSIIMAILHCVCVFAVLTDSSKSINRAAAAVQGVCRGAPLSGLLLSLCADQGDGDGDGDGHEAGEEDKGSFYQGDISPPALASAQRNSFGAGSGSGSGSGSDMGLRLSSSSDGGDVERGGASSGSRGSMRPPTLSPVSKQSASASPVRRLPTSGDGEDEDEDEEDDYLFNYSTSSPDRASRRRGESAGASSFSSASDGHARSVMPSTISKLNALRAVAHTGDSSSPASSASQTPEHQYLSFRAVPASAASVPTEAEVDIVVDSPPPRAPAAVSDVFFHCLLAAASGYVPLLLTSWDSPYGRDSHQHVLYLWPRVVASAVVWLVYAASLYSSARLWARLTEQVRDKASASLAVSL